MIDLELFKYGFKVFRYRSLFILIVPLLFLSQYPGLVPSSNPLLIILGGALIAGIISAYVVSFFYIQEFNDGNCRFTVLFRRFLPLFCGINILLDLIILLIGALYFHMTGNHLPRVCLYLI